LIRRTFTLTVRRKQFWVKALKIAARPRDKVVVATKVRGAMSEGAINGKGDLNNVGLSRQHIFSSIEQRPGTSDTDYVDLYQGYMAGTF